MIHKVIVLVVSVLILYSEQQRRGGLDTSSATKRRRGGLLVSAIDLHPSPRGGRQLGDNSNSRDINNNNNADADSSRPAAVGGDGDRQYDDAGVFSLRSAAQNSVDEILAAFWSLLADDAVGGG